MRPTLRCPRRLLLLLLAVLLCAVSSGYFVRYLAKPVTGLVMNFPEVVARRGRVVFAPKTPFSPAVAAGLLPEHDQILSIGERTVRGIRDVVEADARIRGFQPLMVHVLRDGQQELVLRLSPVPALIRPEWVFTFLFCAALGFMAFYLILRLPLEPAANLISLAALFYLVFTALKPFYYESFFSNLLIHLGKLTSWLMVLFALYFPTPRWNRPGRLAVQTGILSVFFAFLALRLLYFARWSAGQGDAWYALYRRLGQWGNMADGAAFLIYAVLLAHAHLKAGREEDRRQIEWFLAGFLIGVPPYFFLDQLPLILGEPPGLRISMGGFANLFLIFVPLFFLIGLIKHRAFSLRLFFLRYLVYFCLLLLLFAFFLLAYEPVERFVLRMYGLPPRAAVFLVTALLFLVLTGARSLIGAVLERVLFPSHFAASLSRSTALEARNRELTLQLEELNRQKRLGFQTDRLRDLQGLLRGIIGRVGDLVETAASRLAALERGLPRGAEGRGRLEEELGTARGGILEVRDFLIQLSGLAAIRTGLPAKAAVESLVRDALIETRRRFPESDVRIESGLRSTLVCRPDELVQAFRLLLDNCLEASQPPPAVTVRIQEEDRKLLIRIEDSGPGIKAGLLKRLFEPFVTDKPGHEGLGLFLCRALVERNSGTIEIRSGEGGGTAALLAFPLQEAGR